MNKRGQMYILAAVLLSIAIFSVVKVTNKIEEPRADNFEFFVENLKGEKSYVTDLGVLDDDNYLAGGSNSLLEVFTNMGVGTGIILVEKIDSGYRVYNYLGKEVIANCDGCEGSQALQSASDGVAGLTFELGKGGKKFNVIQTDLANFQEGTKYFSSDFTTLPNIEIDGVNYPFTGEPVEAIIFRDISKNYVKVVKI